MLWQRAAQFKGEITRLRPAVPVSYSLSSTPPQILTSSSSFSSLSSSSSITPQFSPPSIFSPLSTPSSSTPSSPSFYRHSSSMAAVSQQPTFHQNQILDKFLREEEKKLTMKQLISFGRKMTFQKLLLSANYVRKELPIRLAHRIADFHRLPYVVGVNKHIEETYKLYWSAFNALRKVPEIKRVEDNDNYCVRLRELLANHSLVLPNLAIGLQQTRQYFENPKEPDEFFRRMLKNRIGRRILAEQHLELSKQFLNDQNSSDFIGVFSDNINPKAILDKCNQYARNVCLHNYGVCPNITYEGPYDVVFAGIPYHAEYCIYELLKNSMRAVVERFGTAGDAELPNIHVTVAACETHVAFRISDQGGGIDFELIPKIWDFSFTTAPKPKSEEFFTPQMGATLEEQSLKWPIAGVGYGLPISRVFAEYFGGSLKLHSVAGHGVDTYVYFRRKVEDQLDQVV